MADLEKQVLPPEPSDDLVSLKKKIDGLQILYIVLFVTSLVLIVVNYQTRAASSMHVLWAVTLGGAVITRIGRQSLVAKYNSALAGGRPAPLS